MKTKAKHTPRPSIDPEVVVFQLKRMDGPCHSGCAVHTPGEWNPIYNAVTDTWIIGTDFASVAVIAGHGEGRGMVPEVCANARLIAAAPQLLDLVSRALDRFTDNDMIPHNSALAAWVKEAQEILATEKI